MSVRALVALLVAGVVSCGGSQQPVQSDPVHEGSPPEPPPPAPEPEPEPEPVEAGQCQGPAPGPGYECVQNCGPPVAREGDPPPGFSWLSPEQAKNRKQFGCPICLPDDAQIATPAGPVAISKLTPGAIVWGVDDAGRRLATRVRYVASSPAPAGHELVLLELADGRVVRASPGHPGPDGRPLGALAAGAELDGSAIVRVRRVPYRGRTFDIVLEAGARYVSDGVVLSSSLSAR